MNEPRTPFGRPAQSTTTATGAAVDQGLRQYMLGVYNYMALGIAGVGVVALVLSSNTQLMLSIAQSPLLMIGFFALIGFGMMAPKIVFSSPKAVAHAFYWAYVALWGVLIAPMLFSFQMADAAQEIYRAFFISASLFGAVSLWGYTTKKDLSGMSQFLFMAGIGLLIALVANWIFQSTLMSLVISSAVILYISAATAYETQMIKSMYVEGAGTGNDRAVIYGAFALLGSFVTMFIHILNILGIMRE